RLSAHAPRHVSRAHAGRAAPLRLARLSRDPAVLPQPVRRRDDAGAGALGRPTAPSALDRGDLGVETFVLEAGRLLVDGDVGRGERGADALLDLVGDGVRLLEAEAPVQLQVQLDEQVRAGPPGAQVVHVVRLGVL